MKKRDQLSSLLHALMHMAASPGATFTSEALALCLATHPVVVRRSMASLRKAGIVHAAAGHGGGWTLARPAADISMGDVYAALGQSLLQAGERGPAHSGCLIEHAIAGAMDGVLSEAEAMLAQRLGRINLADLGAQMTQQRKESTHGH